MVYYKYIEKNKAKLKEVIIMNMKEKFGYGLLVILVAVGNLLCKVINKIAVTDLFIEVTL